MAIILTASMPPSLSSTPTAFMVPLTLSSKVYNVEFTWNQRANNCIGAWFTTWKTADNTAVLFAGKKLVLEADHFAPLHYREFVPPGRLQVVRADGGTADPGLKDLARAVLIQYVVE